jgi:hypothetical protein
MIRLGDLARTIDHLAGTHAEDCGLSAGDPASVVSRVLLVVDVDAGTLAAARTEGFDAVVVHHSVGRHYYTAYQRVVHRAERLIRLGFSAVGLDEVIERERQATRRALSNNNRLTLAAMAERLTIGCVSAHSVADELFERQLDALAATGSLVDLLAGLRRHATGVPLFPTAEAVAVAVAPPSDAFHRPYADLASVSPPSPPLVAALLTQGCDLIVTTGADPQAAQLCAEHEAGLVLVNHIVFDAVGMDLLAHELHRRLAAVTVVVAETGMTLPATAATAGVKGAA